MIHLHVTISEESGNVLQVHRALGGEGRLGDHERALAVRFLQVLTDEVAVYSAARGGGPLAKTVHIPFHETLETRPQEQAPAEAALGPVRPIQTETPNPS